MHFYLRDFPGGPVVKDPPTNAGDMGLIPGPGRSHMPRQLSPYTPTTEAMKLEPMLCNERNHCNEKPEHPR